MSGNCETPNNELEDFYQSNVTLKEIQTQQILSLSTKSKRIVKKIQELHLNVQVYKAKKYDIQLKTNESSPTFHLSKINNHKADQVVQFCFDGHNSSFVQNPDDHEPQILRLYKGGQLVSLLVNYNYIEALGLSVEQYIEVSRQDSWAMMTLIDSNNPQTEKWELEQDVFYEKVTFNSPILTMEPPRDLDQTTFMEQFLNDTDPQKRNKYKNLKNCNFRTRIIKRIKIE